MDNLKKVFVFVEEGVVAKAGQFGQWCAFAETETEALLSIQSRCSMEGRVLKLIQTMEDRRATARDRREDERRLIRDRRAHGEAN